MANELGPNADLSLEEKLLFDDTRGRRRQLRAASDRFSTLIRDDVLFQSCGQLREFYALHRCHIFGLISGGDRGLAGWTDARKHAKKNTRFSQFPPHFGALPRTRSSARLHKNLARSANIYSLMICFCFFFFPLSPR